MAKPQNNADFLADFEAQYSQPNSFLNDFENQYKIGIGATPKVQEEKGFLSNVGSLIGRGSESALASAEVSPAILAGTAPEKKAGIIAKELSTPQAVAPKELKRAQTAFLDEAEAFDKAKHWYSPDALKAQAGMLAEFGNQVLTNPKGAAYLTSQSAANMAPAIVGMLLGGRTGAAVGSAVPVVGTAVGATTGAIVGGFTGQVPLETGSEFIGLVGKELSARGMEPTEANVKALLQDKKFVNKAIGDARTKGITTAAVDSATTLIGGRVAAGPRRAAVEAARRELGAGADAAQIAERATQLVKETPALQKIKAGAQGVALDVAGGGASEAAGQELAYGKVNLSDVGQEMLGEIGGAAIEVPAAAYSATRDLVSRQGAVPADGTVPPAAGIPPVTPGTPAPPPVATGPAVITDEDIETLDEEAPLAPVAKAGKPVNVTWTPDGQTEPQTAAGTLTTWKDGSQFVRVETGVLENGKPTFTNVPVAAQGVQVTPIETPKEAVTPKTSVTPVTDVVPPVVKIPVTTNAEEQQAAIDAMKALPVGGMIEMNGARYRKNESSGYDIVTDVTTPEPVAPVETAPAAPVEPLHTVVNNETKMEASVYPRDDGTFNVAQKDLESGETLPTFKNFKSQEEAVSYANTVNLPKAPVEKPKTKAQINQERQQAKRINAINAADVPLDAYASVINSAMMNDDSSNLIKMYGDNATKAVELLKNNNLITENESGKLSLLTAGQGFLTDIRNYKSGQPQQPLFAKYIKQLQEPVETTEAEPEVKQTPAEEWNSTVKSLQGVSNFPNVPFEELTPALQKKIAATQDKDGKLGGKNIMQFGDEIEKQLKIKENQTRQAEQKTKQKAKSGTLLTKLINLGGVSIKDKRDVTGEKQSFPPGYARAFRANAPTSLRGHIESGDLDDFLPYNMRLEANTMEQGPFDSEPAYDYLSGLIKNGQSVTPYVEAEKEASEFDRYTGTETMLSDSEGDALDDLVKWAEDNGVDVEAIKESLVGDTQANKERNLIRMLQEARDEEQSATEPVEVSEGQARADNKVSGQETAGELELKGQTEAEIKADEAKAKAASEAKAKEEAQAEQKRKAEKETFALTGSDREADKAAAAGVQGLFDKTELENDFDKIKNNTVKFSSGLTSISDLESGAKAKRGSELSGIGIDIGELSANGLNKLAEAILGGTRVFVDSGAFSTFRSNVKNNEDRSLNFDSILEKYNAITQAVEDLNDVQDYSYPRPMFVMPDIVGNQDASLRLAEKYADFIKADADFDVSIPIVPIQKGELTLAEAYNKIVSIIGTNKFVVGLPSNAEAISQNELREFFKEVKPANVHFLGAAADKTLTPLLQIVAKESPKTKVTADASQIRSKILSNVNKGMNRKQAINAALNDYSDPQWKEVFKNYGIKESDFDKVESKITSNINSGMDNFKAVSFAIDDFAPKKEEAPKAKTEAEIEAEEEAAYEALQAKAEAEIDEGPIGQAIARIENGDFETKAQVRSFVNKLERDGTLEDVEYAREGLSDREQYAEDVLDTVRELLDEARDNAVQERMDELESEQDNEITKEEVDSSTDMSKAVHAAIESELTTSELNRINKNYGTTDTDVAVDKFTEDFTDWVFDGAKDVKHALSDLFNKIWLSIKHGMLSIAMLVNINPANIPVQTVNLPVTTYTVKQTVERPKVDFKEVAVPGYIQQVADNRMRAHPNKPIVIVDKQMGLTYMIDANGVLAGKSASLTGKTKGDFRSEEAKKTASVESIAEKDKVTEAGMFEGALKKSEDYGRVITLQEFNNYSVALHQTYLKKPAERRQERLESATPEDNRISFGCINVPNEFMQNVVLKSIPYGMTRFPIVVIPESKSIQAFWPSEDFASSETKYVTKTQQTVPVSAPEKKVDTSAIKQDDFENEGFLYNIESKPQTETPAFKKWFGDSKVVDEDGKPLVVYHGTKRSFGIFAPYAEKATRGGQALYDVGAMFFTADTDLATAYSGVIKGMRGYHAWPPESAYGGNVMPVYLSLKNPLVINAENQIYHKVEEAIRKAKRDGYDGVIINNLVDTPGTAGALDAFVHTAYVAFKPNQIKSAIGNKGTFDETGDLLQNQQQFVKDGIAYESEEDYRDRQIQELRVASLKVGKAVKQIASYGSNLPLQRKLNKLLEREAAIKEYLESTKPDNNSAADFMARATKELAAENISDDVETVIRQVYEKYPGVLEGLKLSLKRDKSNDGTKLGLFNPYEQIVTLYKGTSGAYNAETVRHELMHSLEQMMTPQAKTAVVDEWARALEKAMKKHTDPASKAYFDAVLKFLDSPSKENFNDASKKMPSYDFYQYINPSEYWAVNAEKLFASKLGTPWNRFVLAVKRLIEGLKNVLGFDNNYQTHKVFNNLLKTTPERMSKQMLIDYVTKGKVKLDFLQNVEEDRNLVDEIGVPDVPSHTTRTAKEFLFGGWKKTQEKAIDIANEPKANVTTALSKAGDLVTLGRIRNVWYGAGLDAADFAKYGGQIRDAMGRLLPSIALKNAIKAAYISTRVILDGGLEMNERHGIFMAVKKAHSMANVFKLQAKLRKEMGVELADRVINGYFIAKRSRSIQNDYFDVSAQVRMLEEELLTETDPELVQELSSELTSLQSELKNIKIAYEKIPAFLCKIDEDEPTITTEDGKEVPNVLYDDDGLPLLNDEAIDNLIKQDVKHPELKEMMVNWTAVNHNMLDMMAFSGRISKKEADKLKSIKDYSPWARLVDERQGLYDARAISANTSGIKHFKSGRTELDVDNVIESMTHNIQSMVKSSVRTYAYNRIAIEYGTRKPSTIDRTTGLEKPGKLKVYPDDGRFAEGIRIPIFANGRRIIIQIEDSNIAEAMLGLAMGPIDFPMQNVLSAAANLTRRTITFSLYFQAKQVFYDAPTAAWVSGVRNPFKLWAGCFSAFARSVVNPDNVTAEVLKSAGFGGFQSHHRSAKGELELELGIMNRSLLSRFLKGIDHFGDASDLSQRIPIYEQTIAETGDPMLAILKASDVMDFQKSGNGRPAQWLKVTVPFMQAYATQLDALGQAAIGGNLKGMSRKQAKAQFIKTGSLLAGTCLLYAFIAGGDDDYWELDDNTRLRNFYIPGSKKLFGHHVLIPMHSTASYFFKAIPEMLYSTVTSQGTKNEIDMKRLRTVLADSAYDSLLGPTPIPSGVKPFIEIAFNHDFFTGGNVTPRSLEKLDAVRQYNASTSEMGKMISSLTGTDKHRLLNPIEADKLMRGILGSVGALSMYYSNVIFGEDRVAPQLKDNPLTGGIIGADVQRKNEDLLYSLAEITGKADATFNDLHKKGFHEEAREYFKENKDLIKANGYVKASMQSLDDLNAEIKRIGGSPNDKTYNTPEKRLARINELKEIKNKALKDVIRFRLKAGL